MDRHASIAEDNFEIAQRSDAGQAEPQMIGLHLIVDQALERARARAEERGIVLEARHDPRQRLVQLDAERLRRALVHLVLNALRYSSPDRPLVVWTHFNPQFLEIGVRNAAGNIRAQLSAPPAAGGGPVPYVEAVESLGLDMALAKHFVEMQGGHLELRAAARHGAPASLVVRLPAEFATPLGAPLQKRAAPPARLSAGDRLDGTHVLLVEDDPDALEFLTLILRAAGARVSGYTYTAPAFTFFVNAPPEDRPDVIVSDVAMPIEDGYSFLKRMRHWEASHACLPVPAIAVTAFSRDEDCRRALASGFDRHVPKPLDAAKLVETIAQWS